MASLNETKARLSSTKTTQKVIKAMELVASSKIKNAKKKAEGIDFYFKTTMEAMSHLSQHDEIDNILHPKEALEKTMILSITSDMGLCGAYNSNVIKETLSIMEESNDFEVIALGSKLINKLRYEQMEAKYNYTNLSSVNEWELAQEISEMLIKKHKNKEINGIKIVYTKYINPIRQEVEVLDLLDLEIPKEKTNKVLLVEPSEEEVFKKLLEQYIYAMVYTSILQSFASEHSYRRNSMDTANTNSLDLIQELNLEMNRIRQAMITQEISEIVGGSEALKS